MELHLQTLKALIKYMAPKKDIRLALNSVLLEIDQDKTYYVATNGKALCAFKHKTYESEGLQDGQYLIPREVLNVFSKSKSVHANFTVGDRCTLSDGTLQAEFELISEKYPDWMSLLHKIKNVSDPVPTNVNPDLLKDIFDCYKMSEGVKETYGLALVQNGLNPGYVAADSNENFIGVIMPYRVPETAEYSFNLDNWMPQPLEKVAYDSNENFIGLITPYRVLETSE